jgi:hypothetical protein
MPERVLLEELAGQFFVRGKGGERDYFPAARSRHRIMLLFRTKARRPA